LGPAFEAFLIVPCVALLYFRIFYGAFIVARIEAEIDTGNGNIRPMFQRNNMFVKTIDIYLFFYYAAADNLLALKIIMRKKGCSAGARIIFYFDIYKQVMPLA